MRSNNNIEKKEGTYRRVASNHHTQGLEKGMQQQQKGLYTKGTWKRQQVDTVPSSGTDGDGLSNNDNIFQLIL